MSKKTTAQVAKALGLTKTDIIRILYHYPTLRPVERVDKIKRYLWSDDELEALKLHLTVHPRRKHIKPIPQADCDDSARKQ